MSESDDSVKSLNADTWHDLLERAVELSEESKYDEAEKIFNNALHWAKMCEQSQRAMAVTLVEIARLRRERGDDDAAFDACEEALDLVDQVNDPYDLEFASALQFLAFYHCCAIEEYEMAVALQRNVVTILRRLLDPHSHRLAFATFRLGEILYINGQNDDAGKTLETARSIAQALETPDHKLAAEISLVLGDNCKEQGDLSGCKSFYAEALSIAERMSPPDQRYLSRVREKLASS
jgi:tetratricopeptide (TPR) repeat protein